MQRRLSTLVLAPFLLASCAHQGLLRDLAANVQVAYAPRTRDTTALFTLAARPAPPPIANRDETHAEPDAPRTSLERCRSSLALCRFERVSIARALAAFAVGAP